MLTIVVGGQFGGEGKGKISAYLGRRHAFAAVCRCGGVNSSHTVVSDERTVRLRMMPATSLDNPTTRVFFGAGSLLHVPTLFGEIEALKVNPATVVIDANAGIVTEDCVEEQRKDARYNAIGSTLTGTGHASARRCLRALPVAADQPELGPFIGDVSKLLHELTARGDEILIEGHQGHGLSNYHGDYPYTSSRDSTAAAMLSELGLGPRLPMSVVLVVKAFPTRNHGGRLPGELSDEDADRLGIVEYGGGSWNRGDRRRRVGKIDFDDISRAAMMNTPSCIALTGADYLDPTVRGTTHRNRITPQVWEFVGAVERATGVPVRYISTGPETGATVDVSDAS